jgi:hypothetical protein
MKNKFQKFTSIEKFSDVWVKIQKYGIGSMQLRSKIKLHGTNAAVRIVDGVVTAQKRTQDITPLHDNAGFALWVSNTSWKLDNNVIIYGEWAGPGVQKSDAISLTDRKRFYVFGVLLLDIEPDEENTMENYVIEPDLIKMYIPDTSDIVIIPWFDGPMFLNGEDVETARAIQTKLEVQVQEIGEEDPLVKSLYGISGSGEGLVTAPYNDSGIVNLAKFNSFVFKVKSEAHSVRKTKSPASPLVEIPDSVKDFANSFVTDARCQQMIDEYCEGSMSPKVIGEFLKRINEDILKESKNELSGMDIEWKMVAKEINKRAVAWFQDKNKV